MPNWGGVLKEIQEAIKQNPKDNSIHDRTRRKYIAELHKLTGRAVIMYASSWLQKNIPSSASTISDEDIQALMEMCHEVQEDELDLILHSPGGSPEAAEAIVLYLRTRFKNIRVFVPHLAMSAATMIACAADEIVLGTHSFLGPTDPQIIYPTDSGYRIVPAQAILDQFELAKEEYANRPENLGAWIPMLSQYGPDLLMNCRNSIELSRDLVRAWLEQYMFKNDPEASQKAASISGWLSDHGNFKSHNRHISRTTLVEKGLKIGLMEKGKSLRNAVLSIFHANTITFDGTQAVKICENHKGRAFVKMHSVMPVPITPPIKQA